MHWPLNARLCRDALRQRKGTPPEATLPDENPRAGRHCRRYARRSQGTHRASGRGSGRFPRAPLPRLPGRRQDRLPQVRRQGHGQGDLPRMQGPQDGDLPQVPRLPPQTVPQLQGARLPLPHEKVGRRRWSDLAQSPHHLQALRRNWPREMQQVPRQGEGQLPQVPRQRRRQGALRRVPRKEEGLLPPLQGAGAAARRGLRPNPPRQCLTPADVLLQSLSDEATRLIWPFP